jgi:hypothetical protein
MSQAGAILKTQLGCCKSYLCCPKWTLDKCIKVANDPCIENLNANWEVVNGEVCLPNVNVVVHKGDDVTSTYQLCPTQDDSKKFTFFGTVHIQNTGIDNAEQVTATVQLKVTNLDNTVSNIGDPLVVKSVDDNITVFGSNDSGPQNPSEIDCIFSGFVDSSLIPTEGELFLEITVASMTAENSPVISKCCLQVEDECDTDNVCLIDEGLHINNSDSDPVPFPETPNEDCIPIPQSACYELAQTIPSELIPNTSGDCYTKVVNKAKLLKGPENEPSNCSVITETSAHLNLSAKHPAFCLDVDVSRDVDYCISTLSETKKENPHIMMLETQSPPNNNNNDNGDNDDNNDKKYFKASLRELSECEGCEKPIECECANYLVDMNRTRNNSKVNYHWQVQWDSVCVDNNGNALVPAYDKTYQVETLLEKRCSENDDWMQVGQSNVVVFSSDVLRDVNNPCLRGSPKKVNDCFHIEPSDLNCEFRVRSIFTTSDGTYDIATNSFVEGNEQIVLRDCFRNAVIPDVVATYLGKLTNSGNCTLDIDFQTENDTFQGVVEPGAEAFLGPIVLEESLSIYGSVKVSGECCGTSDLTLNTSIDVTRDGNLVRNIQESVNNTLRCPCEITDPVVPPDNAISKHA